MFRQPTQTGRPPGTRPLPLIGDLISFGREPLNFLGDLQRRYGDVAEFSLGSNRVTAFFHPDDVATVFAAAGATGPLGRGQEGTFARKAGVTGNNGLVLTEGSYWKRQRRTLQQGMHNQRIADYADVIVNFAEETVGNWSAGQERDAQHDMEQLVGRTALKTLLGADLDDATGEKLKRTSDRMLMLNMLEYASGAKLPLWMPTPLRYLLTTTSARMDRLITTAVSKRLADVAATGASGEKDMLDMLLAARDEDGQPLTDIQLRDEIYTLYLAGAETIANTLGIVWTLLARRPELQQRLFDEVLLVVGDDALGYQHVEGLVLADAVVKETLRMYPVVRAINHHVDRPFQVGRHEFGPGHLIWVVPGVTQRDSRWFPEPDEFRPDRWLDGSTEDIPRYAWFPFGGGPRVCLGHRLAASQTVLIIAAVLRQFVLSAAPGEAAELSLRVNGGGHLTATNARVVLGSRAGRDITMAGNSNHGIDSLPRGGPHASWLDRKFQTPRLEFLDRSDVDPRVKQSVVRSLNKFSERNGYNEKFARFVLENAADAESPKILELGAGHGGLSRKLLEKHPTAELTVTDLDARSVADMAAGDLGSHPRARVQVEDATAIDAPDQTYDIAVFAQSFHHLPPKLAAAAIAEATRVARKFLIVDLRRIHPAAQFLRLPLIFGLTMIGEGWATAHDWWISELRAYSPAALSALAHHSAHGIHSEFRKDLLHQFAVLQRVN